MSYHLQKTQGETPVSSNHRCQKNKVGLDYYFLFISTKKQKITVFIPLANSSLKFLELSEIPEWIFVFTNPSFFFFFEKKHPSRETVFPLKM